MDLNLIIQYVVVGVILLAALIYVFFSLLRRKKRKDCGGCFGCGLADECGKPSRREK